MNEMGIRLFLNGAKLLYASWPKAIVLIRLGSGRV